jgi:hypothetical protein
VLGGEVLGRLRRCEGFPLGLCILDDEGEVMLSRKVEATEKDLEVLCSEIARLGGECMVGIDLVGGPATLLEALLLERGERVFSMCPV